MSPASNLLFTVWFAGAGVCVSEGLFINNHTDEAPEHQTPGNYVEFTDKQSSAKTYLNGFIVHNVSQC